MLIMQQLRVCFMILNSFMLNTGGLRMEEARESDGEAEKLSP
jgi:hypothetical protein